MVKKIFFIISLLLSLAITAQKKYNINQTCSVESMVFLGTQSQLGQGFVKVFLSQKCVSVTLNNSKFKIILYDYNKNGFYNDENIDGLDIVPYDSDSIKQIAPSQSTLIVDSLSFICDGSQFTVDSISGRGDFIIISQKIKDKSKAKAFFNSRLPNIPLIASNGDTTMMYDLIVKGKWVFVDFWANWCKPCLEQVPDVEEISNNPSVLVISILYDSEKITNLNAYNSKFTKKWKSYVIPKQYAKDFSVNGLPFGILYDENHNLIKAPLRPENVLKYVKK